MPIFVKGHTRRGRAVRAYQRKITRSNPALFHDRNMIKTDRKGSKFDRLTRVALQKTLGIRGQRINSLHDQFRLRPKYNQWRNYTFP